MDRFSLKPQTFGEKLKPSRPGFRSHKTPQAIGYRERWNRDLLIQLTLDPCIVSFQAGPGITSAGGIDLLVEKATGHHHLVALRDETKWRPPAAAADYRVLRRSTILQEPRARFARAIWAMRTRFAPPGDRLRILLRLQEASDGLPLSELLTCSKDAEVVVQTTFILACEGLVAIELSEPLSDRTVVRRTPHPATFGLSASTDESSAASAADLASMEDGGPAGWK